jgi:hypothetical protein
VAGKATAKQMGKPVSRKEDEADRPKEARSRNNGVEKLGYWTFQ